MNSEENNGYFDSIKIYNRMDKLRNMRGLTIYELTKSAGLSDNIIYNWIDAHSMPTLKTIQSIAKVLGVNPISLLIDEENIKALTAEQDELLTQWNSFSDKKKEAVLNMFSSFNENK